ncbi:hypothetical protein MAC_03836 [Metarhizium acridum CQMa 102]|uniref:F-box domain-containing protein n=1 Tax=Metarhizium acridum (strain CQMa 102) TaxID=655827 RepID=E9E1Y1_METAQ|nr:uncharacterized protein MAC_03836 [Metarhizium acridum CQMa 102]EFY90078.1 hypothetical protein MAC_03836 [Metarhizium acridum CQMa 102]
MDLLPSELLCEILSHLPPSCRPSTRLTSRRFNAILAPQSFPSVPSFIDPGAALLKLESGALQARRRQVTSIWSPSCCVPADIPIPHSFLLAVYLAFCGRQWQPFSEKTSGASGEWDSDSGIGGRRYRGELAGGHVPVCPLLELFVPRGWGGTIVVGI